jgi:hypothetical protein
MRYNYIATSLINMRVIAISSLLCLCMFADAQKWYKLASQDFNYYYQDSSQQYIIALDSHLTKQLADLQKKLNFHTSSAIDVFLVAKSSDLKPNLAQFESGSVSLDKSNVVLNIFQSISAITSDFRHATSKLLIDEMMYGGSLQDKVKNKNLISLPNWAIPGLQHYLAYGWSAESDNAMRVLHDEYGLSSFNRIPNEFSLVKGASFWKFLEYRFGENAIPTLLYMLRLTHKFNASLYFSFQATTRELLEQWQDYYNSAYQTDQKKSNPVQGIALSSIDVIDLYVSSPNTYYLLENSFLGIRLVQYNSVSNSHKTLFYLDHNATPLAPLSGSIFQVEGVVALVSNSEKGVQIYSYKNKVLSKKRIKLDFVNVVGHSPQGVILSQSSCLQSSLYSYDGSKLVKLGQVAGYANSVSANATTVTVIAEQDKKFSIISRQNGVDEIILRSNAPIKQILWAGDSALLFNSSENGIWNGKMLLLGDSIPKSVTNYRSNIVFHQYSPQVFAEYIDRVTFSSLSITEHIKPNDFFSYNSISPSYFKDMDVYEHIITKESTVKTVDSLANYTFQSEVHPSTDFVIANYDSLANSMVPLDISRNMPTIAPDYFSPSVFRLALANRPRLSEYSAFSESYKTLLPSHFNILASTQFVNRFNTSSITLQYLGAIQIGSRDISLTYASQKKVPYQVTVLSRKRSIYKINSRNRYLTNLVQFNTDKKLSAQSQLSHTVRFQQAQNITLATNEASLRVNTVKRYLSDYTLSFLFKKQQLRQFTKLLIEVQPLWQFSSNQKAICSKFSLTYLKSISNSFHWNNRINAGTSFGPNPVFYIIGGHNVDLLLEDRSRDFSNYKSPILYENVFGIRGFGANYRNGTSYLTYSSELHILVPRLFIKKPVSSEMLANLKVYPFLDLATSFYGKSIYDPANILNTRTIVSSTGAITSQVTAFKNPLILSSGVGLSSQVYGYKISLDYAVGFEDQQLKKGVIHLSLGSFF